MLAVFREVPPYVDGARRFHVDRVDEVRRCDRDEGLRLLGAAMHVVDVVVGAGDDASGNHLRFVRGPLRVVIGHALECLGDAALDADAFPGTHVHIALVFADVSDEKDHWTLSSRYPSLSRWPL